MADSGDEIERRLRALHTLPAMERADTLMELGWSRSGRPTPGIEPFLTDPEPMVRIAAAQACWQTAGDPAEAERLASTLADGLVASDEELALMAGTVLTNMGEAAVPALIRRHDQSQAGEPLIVRVIGEIAGVEAVRFLERAARSEDPRIADEAQDALDAIAEEDGE